MMQSKPGGGGPVFIRPVTAGITLDHGGCPFLPQSPSPLLTGSTICLVPAFLSRLVTLVLAESIQTSGTSRSWNEFAKSEHTFPGAKEYGWLNSSAKFWNSVGVTSCGSWPRTVSHWNIYKDIPPKVLLFIFRLPILENPGYQRNPETNYPLKKPP